VGLVIGQQSGRINTFKKTTCLKNYVVQLPNEKL
jgi:hypothetical protein